MRRLTVMLADLADTAPHRSVGELLRWVAPDPMVDIEVVSLHGGVLHDALAGYGNVHVANDPGASRLVDALQTVRLGPLAEQARSRDLRRRLADLDAVWLADLRAARLLHWAGPARSITAHQHGTAARAALDPEDRRVLAERVNRAVAGSKAAAVEIADLADLPVDAVVRRPDLLDSTRQWPMTTTGRSARRAATRSALATAGIAATGPLVISSGQVDFGHGTNPFARICWEVHLGRPSLGTQFVWLTDASTERMVGPLRRDIDRAGLTGSIHVLVDGPPRLEVLLAADAYLHTDALPLDDHLAGDLDTLGVPVVGMSSRTPSSDLRRPRMAVDVDDLAGWRHAVLAVIDPTAAGPAAVAVADQSTDWDVRCGGPALLDLLLT